MDLQKGWLKCQVSEGMLPKEYAVECNSVDGYTFSFFAPQEYIDSEKNLVQVDIIECQSDICLIYVPVDPLEGWSRSVKVLMKDIIEIQ
jgi:hypothetical protein